MIPFNLLYSKSTVQWAISELLSILPCIFWSEVSKTLDGSFLKSYIMSLSINLELVEGAISSISLKEVLFKIWKLFTCLPFMKFSQDRSYEANLKVLGISDFCRLFSYWKVWVYDIWDLLLYHPEVRHAREKNGAG